MLLAHISTNCLWYLGGAICGYVAMAMCTMVAGARAHFAWLRDLETWGDLRHMICKYVWFNMTCLQECECTAFVHVNESPRCPFYNDATIIEVREPPQADVRSNCGACQPA